VSDPLRRHPAGRPPAAERAARRDAALDAAVAELCEGGLERLTMTAVARRAGSSKESLYTWFGSKQGMVAAVIRRESAATNERVEAALRRPGADHRGVLVGIARNLLGLLTGEVSLALNRAAMSSPALAAELLAHGRHTTGPIVEGYLARLGLEDPDDAFRLLYGLTVQDAQIRALLGEAPPDAAEKDDRARRAVDRFVALTGLRSAVPRL
jgi:AcrR family transcriptional regulator